MVAPLSFTVERALVMDSTYPYATNNLAAIYRKPDPALYKWKTYLRYVHTSLSCFPRWDTAYAGIKVLSVYNPELSKILDFLF